MSLSRLHHLLDRNLGFSDEYAGGLSNHLPMALHALHRLGASESRLDGFFAGYSTRLEREVVDPQEAGSPVLADWCAHRGDDESLPALRATFDDALGRDGAEAVLRQAVPRLMQGVGAAAFHGLLRTAHAYEAGHRKELARGLAYWAARWLPLEPTVASTPDLGFADWSDELARRATGWKSGTTSGTALISAGMQAAAASPVCGALAGRLRLDDRTLAQLSALAATLYVNTADFTVLHLVTGCRAARVLMAFDDRPADALGALVRAFTAARFASGVAAGAGVPPSAPVEWSALVALAVDSPDEHCIKLIDACVQESAVHAEDPYRRAAMRALG